MPKRSLVPATILAALLGQGCSTMFVDGPPKIRPGAPVPHTAECTSGSTLPIVDIIAGVASVVAIVDVVDGSDGYNTGEILMFAWPVGTFGSAFHGFRRIRECKQFLATPVVPKTTGTVQQGARLQVSGPPYISGPPYRR